MAGASPHAQQRFHDLFKEQIVFYFKHLLVLLNDKIIVWD